MIGPRRVLVTGAGRRIGAGLSIALAEAGWHVVLHYNQAAKEAQTLCETLTAAGRTVELVQADLAKPDDIDKLMEQHGHPARLMLLSIMPLCLPMMILIQFRLLKLTGIWR